jgi:hypothetical protein
MPAWPSSAAFHDLAILPQQIIRGWRHGSRSINKETVGNHMADTEMAYICWPT